MKNLTIEMIRASAFYKSRPKVIQELIEKVPPTHEYLILDTGHECTIRSYNEEGTLTVTRPTNEIDKIHGIKTDYIDIFDIKPENLKKLDDKPIQVSEDDVINDKVIVVKIQHSLGSNNEGEMVLVYDEEKEFMYEGPMPTAVKQMMGGKPKVYAEASLTPNKDEEGKPDGTFQFSIIHLIEDQPW